MRAKIVFLHACRAVGMFRLARYGSRRKLRVLCYHGFSMGDEHSFRPKLFITDATFRKRCEYLSRANFTILPLEDALERSVDGTLPADACVITIDDGFYGVGAVAAPILREFEFPYTIYVTTYYSRNENPIFRLAVQYLLWKSNKEPDLVVVGVPEATARIMRDGEPIVGAMGAIIDHGEVALDEQGRVELAGRLALHLGADYEAMRESRILSLLNPAEVKGLADEGVDIQLHTHTHRFPEDASIAARELQENAKELSELTSRTLRHFCYPSGRCSEKHHEPLRNAGVRSAVTCELGLFDGKTNLYQVPRLLDGENLQQIEFESEVCGFADWLRRVKRIAKRLLPT